MLADVVPLFGAIVGADTGLIAFLITVVISFFVISVAWIFHRPLIRRLMSRKKRQTGLAPSWFLRTIW